MVSMVEPSQHTLALPDGSMLAEYRIERVLGVSGFGITYLAHDPASGRPVAIEEYLPNDIARRQGSSVRPRSTAHDGEFRRGREQFLETARALLEISHPNLAPATGVFEAHNTGYFVTEHDVGERLDVLLARHERDFDEAELRRMSLALLDALEALSAVAPVHGAIEPSCIQLQPDGSPVLMNLAVSRAAAGRKGRTLAIGLAPGYAAIEQYTGRAAQGPHTDIYALGAVLYRIVTGRDPVDAPARVLEDEQLPASRLSVGRYSRKFLRAVDGALTVRPEDRPQTLGEWREMLAAPAVTERPAPAPKAAAAAGATADGKPAADGELRADRDADEDIDWEPSGRFWHDIDWGRFIPYGIGAAATAGVIALLVATMGTERYREELAAGREASDRLMQERLAEAERILSGLPPRSDTGAALALSAAPPDSGAETRARDEATQRQQAEARAAEEQRRREAAAQQERERQQAEARAAEERRQRDVVAQQERERQQAEAKAAEERRQREVAAQQERERQQAEAKAAEERRQRELTAAQERERQQAEAKAAEERRQREIAAQREREIAAQRERERQQAEARAAEERRQREIAAQQERERQQAEARAAEERRQREIAAQQERDRQQAEARAAEERRQREVAAQQERERQQAAVRAAEEQRQRELAALRERQQSDPRAAMSRPPEERAREAAEARQRELASATPGASGTEPPGGRLLGTIGPGSTSSSVPAGIPLRASEAPPAIEAAPANVAPVNAAPAPIAPAEAAPAPASRVIASATGAPMRLSPPSIVAPSPGAAAAPRPAPSRSVPVALPPAGGAREIGAVADINVGWGYVVLQVDPGTVRPGERIYARSGIERLWMTVRRVNGTQVSATTEVDLRRFTPDLRVYKD